MITFHPIIPPSSALASGLVVRRRIELAAIQLGWLKFVAEFSQSENLKREMISLSQKSPFCMGKKARISRFTFNSV